VRNIWVGFFSCIAGLSAMVEPSAAKVLKFEIVRIESPAFEGRTFGSVAPMIALLRAPRLQSRPAKLATASSSISTARRATRKGWSKPRRRRNPAPERGRERQPNPDLCPRTRQSLSRRTPKPSQELPWKRTFRTGSHVGSLNLTFVPRLDEEPLPSEHSQRDPRGPLSSCLPMFGQQIAFADAAQSRRWLSGKLVSPDCRLA